MSVPPKIAEDYRSSSFLSPAESASPPDFAQPADNGHRVAEHADWVRSLARRLVRDPSGAEDVAQEALLAALSSPPRDAEDSHRLKAWLGRVTHNLSHLALRRNLRRRWREECAARDEWMTSTVDRVASSALRGELKACVRSLAEPYRSSVELRYFEGLSIAAIAAQEDASENAVRKRLWRARNQLRQTMGGMHNGERSAWFSGLLPLFFLGRTGPAAKSATSQGLLGVAAAGALLLVSIGSVSLVLRDTERLEPALVRTERFDSRSLSPRGFERVALTPTNPSHVGELRSVMRQDPPGSPIVDPLRESSEVSAVAPVAQGGLVRGSLVGLDGLPLAGVSLVDADAPGRRLGQTAEDGSFGFGADALPLRLQIGSERFTFLREERIRHGGEATHHTLVAAPATSVAGLVLSEEGYSLDAVQIELRFDERAFLSLDLPLQLDSTSFLGEVDFEGRFELARVPVWEGISLGFSRPGYRASEVATFDVHLDMRIVLRLADSPDELAHHAGPATRGIVRSNSTSRVSAEERGQLLGMLVDAGGRPLADWRVAAMLDEGDEGGEPQGERMLMEEGTTAEDGSFALPGKLGEAYLLMAYHPLHLGTAHGGPYFAGATPIEMCWVPRMNRRGVSGRVVGEDGRPLANARLDVLLVMGREGMGAGVPTHRFVHADENGAFEFADLPGASLLIEADHPSAGPKRFDPSAAELVVLEGESFLGLEGAFGDSFAVLDADGEALTLRGPLTSAARAPIYAGHGGRTAMVAVEGRAHTLVLFENGREERLPLDLEPGERRRMRP